MPEGFTGAQNACAVTGDPGKPAITSLGGPDPGSGLPTWSEI